MIFMQKPSHEILCNPLKRAAKEIQLRPCFYYDKVAKIF
jgi:hypothetical protein